MPHQKGIKSVAQNRKAWHDYFVEEKYECGLALFGTEVKSIRQGRVNLKESWAQIRGGEIWVEGMHISPYDQGNIFNRDPMRPKKLLMHKSEPFSSATHRMTIPRLPWRSLWSTAAPALPSPPSRAIFSTHILPSRPSTLPPRASSRCCSDGR